MALSFTYQADVFTTAAADAHSTTGTFTPTEGSTLVAFVFVGQDSFTGEGNVAWNSNNFTRKHGIVTDTASGPDINAWIWTYTVPASPGTHTVDWDDAGFAGSVNEFGMSVVEVKETDGLEASGLDDQAFNGTSATGTLPGTSGNSVLCAIGRDDQNDTVSWTSPLSALGDVGGVGGQGDVWTGGSVGTEDATPACTWTNTYQGILLSTEWKPVATSSPHWYFQNMNRRRSA